MKLHWSPRSPFVRKVMIAAHELGLVDRIQTVRTVVAMRKVNVPLLDENPLGKLPTLVTDDGQVLYDSLVILQYLDTLHDGVKLFPAYGTPDYFLAMRRHALGTGLLDNLILLRNERDKPVPFEPFIEGFVLKTDASLRMLEGEIDQLTGFGVAEITIGCCLSYLDFRFPELDWRGAHPKLTDWHKTFMERPSVKATGIVDD